MYVCILGEHLVQVMPFVPPLPCDKIDNNNKRRERTQQIPVTSEVHHGQPEGLVDNHCRTDENSFDTLPLSA